MIRLGKAIESGSNPFPPCRNKVATTQEDALRHDHWLFLAEGVRDPF